MSYKDYFHEPDISMTLAQKIELIKFNTNAAANLASQIKAGGGVTLQPTSNIIVPSLEQSEIKNNKSEESSDKEVEKLYNKISLLDITNLSEEEIINRIKSIMGNNPTSFLINKLKLMLYKEYVIYSKMLLQASTKSELAELQILINAITSKIELLDELEELEEEKELTEPITENNNLFFLLSDSGNVIALESLRKNVPREYYPVFKEILLGLKEGKAKGLKRLAGYGYLELKNFKIRVIFDKLSTGNYIILDCFMKKVDTGVSYRNNLANRYNQYQNKKNLYLDQITNPEFIKKHESYLAEILTLLDSKTLEGESLYETRSI